MSREEMIKYAAKLVLSEDFPSDRYECVVAPDLSQMIICVDLSGTCV